MATKKITTEEKKDIQVENPTKIASRFIIAPRITEKASMQSSVNAYTFVVEKNATKLDVMNEVKKEYKVTPLSVNITNMPRQNTFVRGKWGTKAGIKKAIVFLKKGDSITLS